MVGRIFWADSTEKGVGENYTEFSPPLCRALRPGIRPGHSTINPLWFGNDQKFTFIVGANQPKVLKKKIYKVVTSRLHETIHAKIFSEYVCHRELKLSEFDVPMSFQYLY